MMSGMKSITSPGNSISVKDWFAQVVEIFERPFNPKNVPEFVAKFIAGINEFVSCLLFVRTKPQMTRFSVGYMAKSMTMKIEKTKAQLLASDQ